MLETQHLEPEKYFSFLEAIENKFSVEESSRVSAKKLVFELRDKYIVPNGVVGIYRLSKVTP